MVLATPCQKPFATIVVVTHNSANWIDDCMTALLAQDLAEPYEVLVIDHESRDSTLSILQKKYTRVRVVEQSNKGFGAGANRGAKEARGELLAFANPDTKADRSWLRELLAPLGPGRITTSQIVLKTDPGHLNTLGHDLHFAGFGFTRGHGRETSPDGRPTSVPGLSGAAFAIRAEDFRALGGFDEDFFLYLEDTELSWRARERGFKILLAPSSRIAHDYKLVFSPRKLYYLERNRRLLLRKHYSRTRRIWLAPSLVLARFVVWLWALRLGKDGRKSLRDAKRDARATATDVDGPRSSACFTRRTIPFQEIRSSPVIRLLGGMVNVFFLLNTLGRRRCRPRGAS